MYHIRIDLQAGQKNRLMRVHCWELIRDYFMQFREAVCGSMSSRLKNSLSVMVLGCCCLVGCGPLVDQAGNGNIETIFKALAFEPSPRSGDTAAQRFVMIFLPHDYLAGSPEGNAIDALKASAKDAKFDQAVDLCSKRIVPPPRPPGAPLAAIFDPAGAFVAVGNLIFTKVIAELQSRLNALKAAGQSAYYIKREIVGDPEWNAISCIVLRRVLTPDGAAKESKRLNGQVVENVRLNMVIHRRKIGQIGSVLSPVYLRVNHARAQTGVNSKGEASIRVAVTVVITSLVQQAQGKGYVLSEVVNQPFKTIAAPLGDNAEVCDPFTPPIIDYPQTGHVITPCDGETSMFGNPQRGVPLQINFVFAETGSALTTAESALVSLEAVSKAAKPTFEELFKQLAKNIK